MKIIVGLDGSPASTRAVEWCAKYAGALKAEVVAVYAIEMPIYYTAGSFGYTPMPAAFEPDRDALREQMNNEWCAPLASASIPFRAIVMDGAPAPAIIALAGKEEADLVVTGRRGRGGFAELLLGSTSHHLSHHLDRPLVIVP